MRVAVAVLLAVLGAPAAAHAQDAIVVKRVSGLDRAERLAVRQDAGVTLDTALALPDAEVVRARPGRGADALAALNADPDVLYAEPDLPLRAQDTNDPRLGELWGFARIAAPAAWNTTRGAGATVAVVDSGIDVTHPDLAGQLDLDHAWDFVKGDATVEPQGNEHGTHVAGTIAAIAGNAIGVAGVAPEATIVPLKIFGASGPTTASMIANAFDYAGELGVDIVNASLSGLGTSQLITDAIEGHPDTLFVVAAGNNGADAAAFMPCNSPAPNLVCVGASDDRDERASFSNASATAVDLFAPGVDVLSTGLFGTYVTMDGTSMASPHVAAAAALLAAHGATAAEAKTALLATVDAKPGLTGLAVSGGRLNAAAALLGPPPPEPTPTPTPTPQPTPPPAPEPTPPPTATPAPTPPAAKIRSLRVSGRVRSGRPARVTFALSAPATVTFSVRCNDRRGCASALARWKQPAPAGSRSFRLARRTHGRTLSRGRYTLTLSVGGSTRSARFVVR